MNGGGDRPAELHEGGGLRERVVFVFDGSAVAGEKKTRQDASGRVGERLADVQHPSGTNRFEKMHGFVFFG